MEKKSNKKVIIISCVVLAVLVAAFGIIYYSTRPEKTPEPASSSNISSVAESGEKVASKNITVEIVFSADNKKTVEISTDAEYLSEALNEQNLIEGTTSEYGLFITTVDGVTAGDGEWWCIKKDGEMTPTGADTTPIADGDKFELELSTY